MPVNNVNCEALRIVTAAARKHRDFLREEIVYENYDVECGIGCESAVERAKEELHLLETSIFMMEQHIERFDNAQ
jgi:hypothetical protein